jgi:hypothetical protein
MQGAGHLSPLAGFANHEHRFPQVEDVGLIGQRLAGGRPKGAGRTAELTERSVTASLAFGRLSNREAGTPGEAVAPPRAQP